VDRVVGGEGGAEKKGGLGMGRLAPGKKGCRTQRIGGRWYVAKACVYPQNRKERGRKKQKRTVMGKGHEVLQEGKFNRGCRGRTMKCQQGVCFKG